MKFLHLRVNSSYSLANSMMKIPDIIAIAKEHKMPAIGICDTNNMFGSLEFTSYAKQGGIKPLIGASIFLKDESYDGLAELNIFAKDEEGYQNLMALESYSYIKCSKYSNLPHITSDMLYDNNNGLIVLSGAAKGLLGRLLLAEKEDLAISHINKMKEIFGDRYYIELIRQDNEDDYKIEDKAIDIAYEYNIPIVATNPVLYKSRDDYEAYDTLYCIANNQYVDDENRIPMNRESYFKSSDEMIEIFKDVPEAIENTYNIAVRCSAFAKTRDPMLPSYSMEGENCTEDELFISLTKEGLESKISDKTEDEKLEYRDRLDYEIGIIAKMKFSGYFLIVSDFIKWSKANNIPVGPGRGSGAGSLVAWSLDITDLDPIKFGLLFERFLNPERISMPDFDIDFCQERREEVIQYVRHKYGEGRVAQIITFSKLQPRAALRDVGRVLQIPNPVVDRISKLVPHNPVSPVNLTQARVLEPELDKAIKNDDKIAKMYELALKLEGLYRQTSIHAAGVVIADQPLINIAPLYLDLSDSANNNPMPVVQYNMKDAEKAGLVKFDFLGLKTLTVISQTINLLKSQGVIVDFKKVGLDDLKTYELLTTGNANGVFQFESQGMQETLKRLKPDSIDDIIALGALYRPGPMDNIPMYIARKHKLEIPEYYHESLESVLKETYGVIIYQEQVMQIAQILAGYSLGAADLLRRAMGKKIKSEMDAQRDMFVSGSLKNNLSKEFAEQIFDLVAKFAGYGFNKSHAAAYGVISYQTAYLKANYTVEFLIATMNLDILDLEKVALFINEARKFKIKVLPPCINKSNAVFSIEFIGQEKCIRYALRAIKNVGEGFAINIYQNRINNGKYLNFKDFCDRIQEFSNKRSLENLVKAGALDDIDTNRRRLLESIETRQKSNVNNIKSTPSNQLSLFSIMMPSSNDNITETEQILNDIKDFSMQQKLDYEYEVLEMYLSNHPLHEYLDIIKRFKIRLYNDIYKDIEHKDRSFEIVGVAIDYRIKASQKGRFGTIYLSDIDGRFTISVYNKELIDAKRDVIISKKPLYLKVSARKDEGVVRMVLDDVELLEQFIISSSRSIIIKSSDISVIDHMTQFSSNNNSSLIFETKVEDYTVKINIGRLQPTPFQIENIKKNFDDVEFIFEEIRYS